MTACKVLRLQPACSKFSVAVFMMIITDVYLLYIISLSCLSSLC